MELNKKSLFTGSAMVLVAAMLVACLYFWAQPQIKFGDGKGWDGVSYHAMYEHFSGNATPAVFDYPFSKRPGVPYLAAQLPTSATTAFILINVTSGCLTACFTYLALRPRFRPLVVWAVLAPLVFYVFSPLRFTFYYPFSVDPPATLFYAIAAWFASRGKYYATSISLVLSCFFRESGVYFAIFLPGVLLWLREIPSRTALRMLCIGLSAILLTYFIQLPAGSGSQVSVVLGNVHTKLANPFGILRVVAGVAMTIAPFILAVGIKETARRVSQNTAAVLSTAMGGLALVMGILGGTDTTRIFFVAYPLYVLGLAQMIEEETTIKITFLSFAGLVANNFARRIPEPPSGQFSADMTGLFSFFPDHGHIVVALVLIAYWGLVGMCVRSVDWPELSSSCERLRAQLFGRGAPKRPCK